MFRKAPMSMASFSRICPDGQGDKRKMEFHQNKPVFQDACAPSLNWPI